MIKTEKNVSLAAYSTLGVGGNAEQLVKVENKNEFIEALNYAKEKSIPFIVIGSGTNCLVSDDGFHGLVIVNRDKQYEITDQKVTCATGVIMGHLVKSLLAKKLYGLEFATGIPGTVGGAVVGNIGANGGEISEVLQSAEVWDDGVITVWKNADFAYDYRYSKLKGLSDRVVISATFQLHKAKDTVEENMLESKIISQTAADNLRRSRYYLGRTAGSYFKNPEDNKKAAELIDSLELKGHRIGGAEVSTLHANVFRNIEGATASDFYELEKYVIDKVQEKYDITLVPEVIKIGDFK